MQTEPETADQFRQVKPTRQSQLSVVIIANEAGVGSEKAVIDVTGSQAHSLHMHWLYRLTTAYNVNIIV